MSVDFIEKLKTIRRYCWIIYDLGAGAVVGGVKIFWRGLASGYICDVSSSNNLADWTYEVMDWDISGAAGVWKEQQFIPVQKRYIKIEIDPYLSLIHISEP